MWFNKLKHFSQSPPEGLLNNLLRKVDFKKLEHMFLNNSTLLNDDAKVIQKKTEVIVKYFTVQTLSAKINLPSKKPTKIHKNTIKRSRNS